MSNLAYKSEKYNANIALNDKIEREIAMHSPIDYKPFFKGFINLYYYLFAVQAVVILGMSVTAF